MNSNKAGEGLDRPGPQHTAGGNASSSPAPLKSIWRLLRNPTEDLSYDSAIPLLGICPKDTKSVHHRDTCPSEFTTVLFTVAKLWIQPGCPATEGCIRKILLTIKRMKSHHMRGNGCN